MYHNLDGLYIYPNQFITVTPHGYTKHYFAGTERIATAIGGGGFCNMVTPTDNMTSYERDKQHKIIDRLYTYLTNQHEDHTKNEDISHVPLSELQYNDPRQTLYDINCGFKTESLCSLLEYLCHKQKDDVVFYYHPDHLGGAAWITDMSGKPVQYLHYAPYGELVANQMPYGIDERFKFTGKERDAETGYDNFEARPYLSSLSIFGKVDQLSDKYIGTQPYLYCSGNPIRFVDPTGMGPNDRVILAQELVNKNIPYHQDIGYYLRTATSPEALGTMDCSEFVCRVMAGDGITSTIESHSTRDMLANMMSDKTKFIKSDIPQVGDIVLWAGHTGIVESYNEKDGYVTVLHATQYGPIKDETGKVISFKVSSTRREKYSLNAYYRQKYNAFFYRPVNETPDVFENSSTIKLPEITVKPSKDDLNENH